MNPKAKLIVAVAVVLVFSTNAQAVQLLPNWDFELISVDEEGQPILDSVGNEVPSSWFRDQNVTDGVPHTELISPNNMNNAAQDNTGDDSTGTGTNSVALNSVTMDFGPVVVGLPTDWRSQGVASTPGETLIFAFDFKFIDVNDQDPSGVVDEGFLAQIRTFDGIEEGGSTSGAFTGEISPLVLAKDYANDVWHSIAYQFVVPGGNYTDVRFSANIFGSEQLSTGQVLLDKIAIHRLTADFNTDLLVDGFDLEIWEANYGLSSGALPSQGDADGDGMVDGFDFLAWQREFGLGAGAIPHNLTASIGQIPEPSALLLSLCGTLSLMCHRRTFGVTKQ